MHTFFRICLGLFTLVTAARWLGDPEGKRYEPLLAMAGAALLLGDILFDRLRRKGGEDDVLTSATPPASSPVPSPAALTRNRLEPFRAGNTAAFCAERFAQAFPGVRGARWFEGKAGAERLAVLLETPLRFQDGAGVVAPLWRFDGEGGSEIDKFSRLDAARRVLLETLEFDVDAVAAVHAPDYKQIFVYVQTGRDRPVGVNPITQASIDGMTERWGYAWEEYALFRGTAISLKEFDDGATVVLGKPVSLGDEASRRTRYLTPYSFLIAAHGSRINNPDFDVNLNSLLRRIRQDRSALAELELAVRALPYRDE